MYYDTMLNLLVWSLVLGVGALLLLEEKIMTGAGYLWGVTFIIVWLWGLYPIVNFSHQDTNIEIKQIVETDGYPMDFTDLPDGSYRQIEKSEHLAFVQSENENPFKEGIIAIYSSEKIPQQFSMEKGRIASVTIENPLPIPEEESHE